MTTKAANYTPEMEKKMVEVYTAAKNEDERSVAMDAICVATGKRLASVRAKLANLGVYVAKKAIAKKSTSKVKKADIVTSIATLAGETYHAGFFDSLESANKTVLEYIVSLQSEVARLDDTFEEEAQESAS